MVSAVDALDEEECADLADRLAAVVQALRQRRVKLWIERVS